MATLDDLVKEVAAEKDDIASVRTFIEGLEERLNAAGSDPAKVQAVLDAIVANRTALVAAITTPGA